MSVERIRHIWQAFRGKLGHSIDSSRRGARRCVRYFLAWANRRLRREVTVVGITGSAGKTTVKDLCTTIISEFGLCVSSVRSENEHDGVAETIRRIGGQHRFCVVELSAGRPGYLDLSLKLSRPDVAVLTMIARDHFSAFKSVDAIAQEKGKIVSALRANGTAVLNIDDPHVRSIGEACKRRVIWVGEGEGATLRLRQARSRWPEPLTLIVEYRGSTYEVPTRLHGTHLALAVLSSLGVALALDMPLSNAIAGLMQAEPPEGRMQVVTSPNGVVFVRDDWKAPQWSLEAPFEFMRQAQAARKVFIIGTLSDYSLSASKLYPKVARQALEIGELVIFVGPHSMRALKARRGQPGRQLLGFPFLRDASEYLKTALQPGDLVLLKGSHKADHLVRLILDREKAIYCWQEKCGRSMFCWRCEELYKGAPPKQPQAVQTILGTGVPSPVSSASEGTASPFVIVGLGNPDPEYSNTPHNVGHRVLEELASAAGSAWQTLPEGQVSIIVDAGLTVALLKPGVSMNRCGEPLRRFLGRICGVAEKCIVIHDDMDLSLGDVRLKRSGGDAGHLGVRSVIFSLETGGFERIRLGVRRAGNAQRARELVLTQFSAAEREIVDQAVARAASMAIERGSIHHARSSANIGQCDGLDIIADPPSADGRL